MKCQNRQRLISHLRLHGAQELHSARAPGAPAGAELHDAESARKAQGVAQHGLVDGHVFTLGVKKWWRCWKIGGIWILYGSYYGILRDILDICLHIDR